MRLHDLRPADGSRTPRTRVGRGIAAGKGKTAGRGTKGQKARAGGSIPPWFEGGQTPLHMRIPKLRGFKNRFKIEYEVVNVGAIAAAVERGAFEAEAADEKKSKTKAVPQITINQDILRTVGLVRTLDKPLKILGAGELSAALFVVADAFTASARTKIEAAGGSVNVLEIPGAPRKALGVGEPEAGGHDAQAGAPAAATPAAESDATKAAATKADASPAAKAPRARKASPDASAQTADADEGGAPVRAEAATEAEATAEPEAPVAPAATEPETDEGSATAETSSGDDA
jgi:large subunit ribosomal protein L15